MNSFTFPRKLPDDVLAKKACVYRKHILEMIHAAGSGHPGGSLSLVDIMVVLFNNVIRHDPKDSQRGDRDRFILSKGHGCPALYAALADTGHIKTEELKTLRQLGSRLQGHPDRERLPIVEASTGSLGQGLSIAQGAALAQRLDGFKESRVYCVIGDGESQEGQIWETAMSAPKFQLDNLIAILDYNHGQIDGPTDEVMSLEPVADKWRAFNWDVHVVDGHALKGLNDVFEKTRVVTSGNKGKPRMIIANTIKGKGVSFMENVIKWHGVAPTADELSAALREISSQGLDLACFGPRPL